VLGGGDPKLEAMARVPLFARLSRGDLKRVAKIADEVDLPAGKALTKEGERGREFFVILEGRADVRSDTRLLRPLGPGDFLGEIALVTDSARTATVTALTPIRALVVTDRAFRELLRKHPDIQGKVLAALGDRLAASER
jgi:CRP/FNR family transcriptional regulator, cyclic AMP receptor protein